MELSWPLFFLSRSAPTCFVTSGASDTLCLRMPQGARAAIQLIFSEISYLFFGLVILSPDYRAQGCENGTKSSASYNE